MRNPTNRLNWLQRPSPMTSRIQRGWLTRAGALTTGLRQLGVVKLRVLRQHISVAHADEAQLLKLPPRHLVWTREISMSIQDELCVVARSVTPLTATRSHWKGIRGLKARPLADILYQDKTISRSNFAMCRIKRPAPLYRLALNALEGPPNVGLLARRSVFRRARQPLMVSECFLPAFWRLLERQSLTIGMVNAR